MLGEKPCAGLSFDAAGNPACGQGILSKTDRNVSCERAPERRGMQVAVDRAA